MHLCSLQCIRGDGAVQALEGIRRAVAMTRSVLKTVPARGDEGLTASISRFQACIRGDGAVPKYCVLKYCVLKYLRAPDKLVARRPRTSSSPGIPATTRLR